MYAPQQHHSKFQDAEWTGFLQTLEHENPTACSEFEFSDFDSTTQAGPGAMTTMAGLPMMSPASASSSGSALITPPDSATHPGASWPGTSAPVMAFPPALMQHDIGYPWVDAQGFHTVQHFQHDQGLGIHIPQQLRNDQQHMRFDHVIKHESPAHGRIISLKQSPTATWQRPYQREQSFGPTSDCNNHGDIDEEDAADPCYAQLLFRCLKEAPEHTLSLKDIYDWVSRSSNKAKDPKMRGWQNSVRHNLSMNAVSLPLMLKVTTWKTNRITGVRASAS